MKTARTHSTHSLAESLHAAKPAMSQLPGQDSFKLGWQNALNGSAEVAGLAQRLAGDKAKTLKDGDATEAAANAAKAGAALKKGAAVDEATVKAKAKHGSKAADEGSVGDAKAVDGTGSLTGVAVAGVPGNVQPVQAAKKELNDANAPGINSASNSASTSTLQQAPLPPDMAVGPVEITAAKQMETSVLESKTKRVSVPSIAGLSEKTTAGAVGADGLPISLGATGMAVGGVAGSGVQGGHSSGASGHSGQQATPSQAAAAGPQLVASSPSQLDVGVYDDTHGWLRIRAELGAGGAVNATVTSADAAHESLKTALPAMTHYLGTESVNVNSISLDKFGDTGGSGQPGSHGAAQQQGSTTGQHSSGDQQQTGAQANAMAMLDDAAAARSASAISDDASSGTEVEAVAAIGAVSATATVDAVGDVASSSDVAGSTESVAALANNVAGDGQVADVLGTQVFPWQVGVGGSGGWVNVSA